LLANRITGTQAVAAAAASAVAASPLVAPGIAAAPAAAPKTEVWTLDRVNLLLDQPEVRQRLSGRISQDDYDALMRLFEETPPAMLTRLARDEYQPAYLFHRAPLGSPPDGGAAALKGLKQYLPDRAVSLSGATSQFTIPAGTDIDLSGVLDKELTSAVLRPRS